VTRRRRPPLPIDKDGEALIIPFPGADESSLRSSVRVHTVIPEPERCEECEDELVDGFCVWCEDEE